MCLQPEECWCKPGWSGDTCSECLTSWGCVNGYCEEPFQCICEDGFLGKEVCNGGVACSPHKLGSLYKTVIASLFQSGLLSGTIFFVEKTLSYVILGNDRLYHFLIKKKDQNIL